MKNLVIKFDYSHGPIWKEKYDKDSGKWSTGIKIIDEDKALSILNDEAEKEYSSLYHFDEKGVLIFDYESFQQKKNSLLSLTQTIISRANALNDGTFTVVDEATKILR